MRFTVLRKRIIDRWITEFVLSYAGAQSYAVNIMEFCGVLVADESQYFADRKQQPPRSFRAVPCKALLNGFCIGVR
jgi:hypothetical protein